jgi:hypothetical protein
VSGRSWDAKRFPDRRSRRDWQCTNHDQAKNPVPFAASHWCAYRPTVAHTFFDVIIAKQRLLNRYRATTNVAGCQTGEGLRASAAEDRIFVDVDSDFRGAMTVGKSV